jgi:uncharacterized membrane protein
MLPQPEIGIGAPIATIDAVARNLGWFSLGLGLAQVLAPRQIARLTGVPDDEEAEAIMRLVGIREIGAGLAVLTPAKPTPGLWARVAGDAIDLALLSRALSSPRSDRGRVLFTIASILGITVVDATVSMRVTQEPDAYFEAKQARPIRATAAITINAPASEVYAWWAGFQRLPQFMQDAASVEMTGDGKSRWTFSAPGGVNVAWDIEVSESRPNEQIAWRTGEGAPFSATGRVRFRSAPRDQGTEVIFDAEVQPPGGELGKTVVGAMAQALGAKLGNDLRRLKQLIELGEVVRSDDSVVPGPSPAQPVSQVPADIARSLTAA